MPRQFEVATQAGPLGNACGDITSYVGKILIFACLYKNPHRNYSGPRQVEVATQAGPLGYACGDITSDIDKMLSFAGLYKTHTALTQGQDNSKLQPKRGH